MGIKIDHEALRVKRLIKRLKLKDIGALAGYESSNVGTFERGENNNARILMAYLYCVLNDEELIEFVRGCYHDNEGDTESVEQ